VPNEFQKGAAMQENGEVGFDPVYIYRPLPVSTKLFVLYTLVVATVSLVRWIRLLRQVWWLKRHSADPTAQLVRVWDESSSTIQASKRLVVLTCLLSGAITATQAVFAVADIASQKSFAIGALNGGLATALVNLELGLWVSTAIYAAFAFCERVLERQRSKQRTLSTE
jgi:hypothetical protein